VFSIDEMHSLLCCPFLIINVKTQTREGLILYNTTNGITTLQKHVYANHYIIAKILKKK
jgi:hypothetical protein